MAVYGGPDIVTDGLVLHLDAANDKSYDPVVEDCSLVLNMEGSNGSTTFTDGSKYGHTVTANGNAQISTGNSRFGASSAYFDGNGDYVQIGINNAFVFGTGQFTVEFWIYWDGTVSGTPYMGVAGVHNSNGTGRYGIFMTSSGISHYIQTAFPGMASLTANKWTHVASTRDQNGVCRFFLDGVIQSTVTDSGNLTAPQGWRIGTDFSSGRPTFPGYIDSFRVIKGKALYTENFTPPKKSFPEYKWSDLSGNDNNGTFVNGVAYGSSNYGVMSFDGSNDYSQSTSLDTFLTSQEKEGYLTYEYWLKPEGNIRGDYIQSNSSGQFFNPSNPTLQGLSGTLSYNYGSSSSIYVGFGFAFGMNGIVAGVHKYNYHCPILVDYQNYNGIHQLVLIKNINNCSYYINGEFKKTSLNVAGGASIIGDDMTKITTVLNQFMSYFQGTIYSVKFYKKALSTNEVRQNFEATKGRYGL